MNNIKLFFAGDFCSLLPPNDIKVMPELVSMIKDADMSVCNFETPVKPNGYKMVQDPTFNSLCQSAESVSFLEDLGFNLFSLANNHAFDCGDEGYKETLKQMKKAQYLGAGTFDEAFKVKVIEKKGVKVGFLALTYASFGVFDGTRDNQGLGCAYINHPSVNHIILEAKKEVDVLIILAHDGIEYTDAPTHVVRARYKDLIDYGADAIVACHPHCPQGWEDYKGHPIFYSLGNFFFNSKSDPNFKTPLPHWYNGLVVNMTIDSETKVIHYSVLNTLSENRHIVFDSSNEIKKNNEYWCGLLADEKRFDEYWNKTIGELYKNKYIPFCEYTFNTPPSQKGLKGIVKRFVSVFSSDEEKSFKRFMFIMRSDTERELFLKGIKQVKGFS